MKPKATRENTLQIDPSPVFRGTGKVALMVLRSPPRKLYVDARVAITDTDCACVKQHWQTRDERGRWNTVYERRLCCEEFYTDLIRPEGFTGTRHESSMAIQSNTNLFVDARVVITLYSCGCVDHDWQTRNERKRWTRRFRDTASCNRHRSDDDD